MNSENPYLRLRSYTETDAQYFKGRETESGEIFDLLRRNDVVVLYSESAEGKSSILAAGLYPRLRRRNFLPVSIVFTEDEFAEKSPDFDALILGRIRQAMAEANPGGREPLAPDFGRKVNESECFEWVSTSDVEMPQDSENAAALTGSAWWMLRDFAIERYGVRVCPVLVFDQFEEVFTRAASAWTDAFFGWLERLFSDNVPETVGNALDAFPEDEEPEFSTRKDFRTIVSMRNEYMGELDYWGVQRHFLPEFKNSRYCLRALTLGDAEEVLDLRFADRPELKKSVLAALSGVPASKLTEAPRDLPMVPAMLLSVVCGVLCEEKSAQKYLDNLKDGNSTAVDNILWDFYRTSMRECRIGPTMRKYIEDVLVDKGGKRVRTKVDSKALRRIGFRDKILPQLKKKGLVKTSRINGEDYVELVHDRLAAIIEKSRTRRSSSKQRVAMMFIVILACLIMLFLGTRQQLYSDTLENHPFAQLDEAGEKEVLINGAPYHLENNQQILTARFRNVTNIYDITISNCLNLRTLTIENFDIEGIPPTINITDCPNLQSVILKGNGLLTAHILTDEKFVLYLNPELTTLEIYDNNYRANTRVRIVPSNKESSLGIVNFESSNGIVFNNIEKKIAHINADIPTLAKFYNYCYYPFPEAFDNIEALFFGVSRIYNANYRKNQEILRLKFNSDSTTLEHIRTPFYSGHVDLSGYRKLETIANNAFENSAISSVSFPENLSDINPGAFRNCKNLRTVELPDSLKYVSVYAFEGCDNLERLKINSRTRIHGSSFPKLQISDVEVSENPGSGSEYLRLSQGALLDGDDEPVLLTASFDTDPEYFKETYDNPEQFYRTTLKTAEGADYFIRYDDLFYIPVLDSGEIDIFDESGRKTGSQKPEGVIYFNNDKNRDSVIYISPYMSWSDINFIASPDFIRAIHLPFGEPYYGFAGQKYVRPIHMTQEQMMNTVLYVPYGCADNYNIPAYKWFKEIREDSWMERIIAPLKTISEIIMKVFILAIVAFLFILGINHHINRKKQPKNFKRIINDSLRLWQTFAIGYLLPLIAGYYLAYCHSHNESDALAFANIIAIPSAIIYALSPLLSPQILGFVSRIFNRYVIDPLALLFH